MASTRIVVILKSTAAGSTPKARHGTSPSDWRTFGVNIESTNCKATALLAPNVERLAHTSRCEEANSFCRDHCDRAHCCFERLLVFRYNERLEPNRDAGFAAEGRSLVESANPGRADCKPI